MRLHQVHIALALGTHNGLVVYVQAGTDRFELFRDVGAPAIGNQGLRRAIAGTGRIEHREGGPTRFQGCQSAGEDGAGVAIEYDDAPPLHAADAGISVNNAADVAKSTADFVLLRQDLSVLKAGIVEGRRTFANTLKYIAGLHPIYIVRQLYKFQDGRNNGTWSPLMKRPVEKLTDDDIIAIAAYLGSLTP